MYMLAHYHFFATKRKNNYFFTRNLISHANCYLLICTHTQKNVVLVLRKLLNLNFLLFKKIFFVQIIITYLKGQDKLNNHVFKRWN